jgi:hypothetical protein
MRTCATYGPERFGSTRVATWCLDCGNSSSGKRHDVIVPTCSAARGGWKHFEGASQGFTGSYRRISVFGRKHSTKRSQLQPNESNGSVGFSSAAWCMPSLTQSPPCKQTSDLPAASQKSTGSGNPSHHQSDRSSLFSSPNSGPQAAQCKHLTQ